MRTARRAAALLFIASAITIGALIGLSISDIRAEAESMRRHEASYPESWRPR